MPTPKQVRFHYARIARTYAQLCRYLNEAHEAEVIKYNDEKFSDESPCSTNWRTWDRVEKTTEAALAQAMRDEIRKSDR